MISLVPILALLDDYKNIRCDCFVCGGEEFPYMLAQFTSSCVTIIKIIVPIILIILGVIDMLKATSSQKEDEMKKAQNAFIKRLISALLVFFIIAIVQFTFNILSNTGFGDATQCLNSFVNGNVSGPCCCDSCSCDQQTEKCLTN